MRRMRLFLLLIACFTALPCKAKDVKTKFKSVEIKHFVSAEGVELSPQFPDFLYAELKVELQKAKLFDEIMTEGEVVDPSDAPYSLVVEGNLLEYKKGSVTKSILVPYGGFGAFRRSLRAQVKVWRRSNNENVLEKELRVKAPPNLDEKLLARELAHAIANEMKHQLKG